MTTIEGVCEKCGQGTHIEGDEGRVACDGCGMPTQLCKCETGDDQPGESGGGQVGMG